MKNISRLLAILLLVITFWGCDSIDNSDAQNAPIAPRNLSVLAVDNGVEINWDYNSEADISHYDIYVNSTYDGNYLYIGSTTLNYYFDGDAINGETYYYAVAAVDIYGNESELSYDVAFAIPRPDDFNEMVYDYLQFPNDAGFSFSLQSVVEFNSPYADFFFENNNGTFWLNVWADTDIQDVGVTNDIYDVTSAPSTGWVELQPGENVKYLPAAINHTYVIWTNANHYAKIRISNITNERVVFDWAYQLVEGETLLKKISVPITKDKVIINRK